MQALFGESHPVWDPFIRVRGPSNGLTDHCGRDGCRGLLMHAGLLFVVWLLLLVLVLLLLLVVLLFVVVGGKT